MNKLGLLKLVNMGLLVSFLVQAITSIVLFSGIEVPQMKLILKTHIYNGLVMVALALIHLVLNWGWIRANFIKR
jgi:hypothetical protein